MNMMGDRYGFFHQKAFDTDTNGIVKTNFFEEIVKMFPSFNGFGRHLNGIRKKFR